MKKSHLKILLLCLLGVFVGVLLRGFFSFDEQGTSSHSSKGLLKYYSQADSANQQSPHQQDESKADKASGEKNSPSQSGRAPAASQQGQQAFLSFLNSNTIGPWKPRYSRSGDLYRVTGGKIPEAGKSVDSIKKLVGTLAGELGIPADQVQGRIESQQLRSSKVFDAVQTYNEIEVYQSWMRFMANRETGDVYLINNKLKVLEPNIELQVNFTEQDAEDIVMAHYGSSFQEISRKVGQVIFADRSPHQLAYVFYVNTDKTQYRTVVGAVDQKVLLKEKIPVH